MTLILLNIYNIYNIYTSRTIEVYFEIAISKEASL